MDLLTKPRMATMNQLEYAYFDQVGQIASVGEDVSEETMKAWRDSNSTKTLLDLNKVYRVVDNKDNTVTVHYAVGNNTSYINLNMSMDDYCETFHS